ncbi:DUF4307 domain-containing protein [Subtercola sp. YIM 133946]|uniref:DUF4307 domain-containing protein n=1 Tax=Subtercola sp. YIM 133946 TaxID=3118909 RepID=UPI002F942557
MNEDELSEDGVFAASTAPLAPASSAAPAANVRAERYGRTPKSGRRNRLLALGFGAAVVLVIGSWVIWAGFDGTASTVDAQDKAYTVVSDTRVDVTLNVSVASGRTVSCAVEAQNEAHAVVGFKVIDVPASAQRTQQITTTVLTTEPAVTGVLDSCWLTSS